MIVTNRQISYFKMMDICLESPFDYYFSVGVHKKLTRNMKLVVRIQNGYIAGVQCLDKTHSSAFTILLSFRTRLKSVLW